MARDLKGFIICSIGEEKSLLRRRSEWLKTNVIDNALKKVEEKCGVVIRSEIDHHDRTARDIFQSLVDKIIYYDFLFVVILEENANIYYELGIAHSAGRDVHILVANEKGKPLTLPFDIRLKQVIEFNRGELEFLEYTETNSLGIATATIADSIIATLEAPPKPRQAFGSEKLDPLGSRHASYVLHERFTHSLPFHSPKSAEFFASAEKRIVLAGVSLIQLTQNDEVWPGREKNLTFLQLLQVLALETPIDIDVVILHEDNPAMPQMLASFVRSEEDSDLDVRVVQKEIKDSTRIWQAFLDRTAASGAGGRLRLLKIRKGIVYNRLMLTDRALIATPYFYHAKTNGTGPAIEVSNDTSLYRLVTKDLEFIEHLPETEIFSPPVHAKTG